MNFANIFQDIHGEIDLDDCLKLIEHPEYQPENFNKMLVIMDAENDKDGFYINPHAIFHPYFYAKNGFYYSFTIFDYSIWKSNDNFNEGEQFKNRKNYFNNLLNEGKYSKAIFLTEKKFLFKMYQELFDKIPNEEKFDIFMEIYTRSEYGFNKIDPKFIRKVFNYRFDSNEWTPFKKLFPELGDYINIYRGITSKSSPLERAYSWTLDKDVAKFFATRFKSRGKILKAKVKVENIIYYTDDRSEKEVIVLPEHIEELTRV